MIDLSFDVWKNILLALAVAFVISFAATPVVSSFAKKVGAIDIPDKKRHIHSHPIPRMGGLAIFLGFLLSVLLFANITPQVRGHSARRHAHRRRRRNRRCDEPKCLA